MTLEDFFTLNELENGLTTPARVNELITMMQSEKDLVVNSFGQTTQQWSRVATIIAATKNNDCLDLFIQLNGLLFFDKWLKDAQKLKNDDENGFWKDLITSLLRALEKLQTDDKRLFSSGIKKTVQDLVADNSHTVSEKAKELCDNWRLVQDDNKIMQDAKNSESVESQTKNQEPMNHVDPSSKSTDNDDNGDSSSKSEGVGKSHVKNENEINFRDKKNLKERKKLSSPSEQIASNANVDNSLESCIKTGVLSDKVDAVTDVGESLKTSSNSDIDNEADNTIVVVQSNGNSENGSSFKKLSTDDKKSDMELDYDMIDPLDIARQVSVEMEREVDSPERSCTSEKTPGGVKRPNTPESENGQGIQGESQSQNQPVGVSDKEVSPEPVKEAETLVSQISEVAQGSELDTGRPFSGFDLNQEVCSEEVDNLDNPVSSSTSVVSASHAPAAGRIPAAPLGFEGPLGQKGSASINVSQAVPEGPGAHSNSNQQLDSHDFDLNVAEGGQEDIMVIISGLPSGEESSVANPRKPERLQWDLNSTADDQSRWQSPYHASSSSSSSASSSSSSKQPNLRNIDLNLNDQPPNGAGSVISIFGARVEVKQNDLKPQPEPKVDFNHGRHVDSSMHHGHHNGMLFTMPVYGSSSHGMPMPMPMHTQIPYMVDSRGTPFAPQIMGSQSPSPFFMNMAAAGAPPPPPPPLPHHNFDLNTGLMTNGGLRQLLPQHVNEHAASSSVLGKRHEPDSSWQFFPVSKRQQPSWR